MGAWEGSCFETPVFTGASPWMFSQVGTKVKVDTRTGQYLSKS